MSAFMCSDRHLSVIALFAFTVRDDLGRDFPRSKYDPGYDSTKPMLDEALFTMLEAENVASLNSRYPQDQCEPNGTYQRTLAKDYLGLDSMFSPDGVKSGHMVRLLSLIHCYEYQACEHDGWETSDARALCRALEGIAIRRLPGYREAPWGIADSP